MVRIGIILLLVLSLVSCGGSPTIKNSTRTTTLDSPFDDVWTKTVRFLTTNQIGIQTIEKDSGLIVLSGKNLDKGLTESLCETDGPFMNSFAGGIADGNVTVVEEGDFTTVSVNMKFSAAYVYNSNITVIACNSTGEFEDRLIQALK